MASYANRNRPGLSIMPAPTDSAWFAWLRKVSSLGGIRASSFCKTAERSPDALDRGPCVFQFPPSAFPGRAVSPWSAPRDAYDPDALGGSQRIVADGCLAGATSATYTIASTAAADAGQYRAVVTNSAGSATSNAATLTVHAAGSVSPAACPCRDHEEIRKVIAVRERLVLAVGPRYDIKYTR